MKQQPSFSDKASEWRKAKLQKQHYDFLKTKGVQDNIPLIYHDLQEKVLRQYKKFETDLGYQQYDHDKLYGETETIKWVRIPMFPHENKMRYHSVFIVYREHWKLDELPDISADIKQNYLQHSDTDNYTIIVYGLQGCYVSKPYAAYYTRKYNMILINARKQPESKVRALIYKRIYDLIDKRCQALKDSINSKYYYYHGKRHAVRVYGVLKACLGRLYDFLNQLLKGHDHFCRIPISDIYKYSNIRSIPVNIHQTDASLARGTALLDQKERILLSELAKIKAMRG